ncbi:MAG: regulatory protein RecX [bacterium]|nr:regulatory protein RecX [bacterium]
MTRWKKGPAGEPAGPPASEEEQERAAREIVLRQLAMMARSREQLREKILARGVSEPVAERVLDRFTEVGLVDDAAFAESLVRTQRESRGLSRRGLAAELTKRGVDREVLAEAVAAVGDEDEYETALRLARKRASATAGLERPVRERRIAGMLARKGYGASVAYRAVREALEEEPGY